MGISIDMAPCQKGGRVKEYVDRRTAEGRLVLEYIEGGLTSVLQVCDLIVNKDIRAIIKKRYLKYRSDFIKAERAKYPDEPNKRISMKLPIVKMMDIIEESVKEFNFKQRGTESIKNTFIQAGQHPWKDCKDEFKAHLDKLSKLPLYGGCSKKKKVKVTDLLAEKNFESRESLKLGLKEGQEVEQDTGAASEVAEEVEL